MEQAELPKLVIVGIALAGLGLLVINAVLVAWFIIRRRNKGIFNFPGFFCGFSTGDRISTSSVHQQSLVVVVVLYGLCGRFTESHLLILSLFP